MTSRERLVAAARGGEVDRQPVLSLLEEETSDALVVRAPMSPADDRALLVYVRNPFGHALLREIDLNAELRRDPDSPLLEELVEETRREMRDALDAGADGVVYRLHGARALHCSPMQYGGHYLERDRELLEEVKDARLNVLLVVGDDDAYLDFVSDLPAQLFAWDSVATGVTAAQVREMRAGAVASQDPASDVLLVTPEKVSALLEN